MPQGGIIGKPNVPTVGRASGLWRVGEVFRARTTGDWPLDLPPGLRAAIANEDFGAATAGGFYAGLIDTFKHASDIDPNDTRQNRQRYALIVSPRAIGEPSSNLQWRTSQTGFAEARTRWDGLYVTDLIIDNETLSNFPIYEFCDQVRTSDPVPNDGGSDWYIPAMDELELLYLHFKPGPENNVLFEDSRVFPSLTQNDGVNPSSDPQGTAYTTLNPEQTSVTAFRLGNAEAMDYDGDARYWSATEADPDRVWRQDFRGSNAGRQLNTSKDLTNARCRLVRRVRL